MANKPKKKAAEPGMTAISVRIPTQLQIDSKEKSERTGVPISFVVRKALEEWVKTKGMFVLYDSDGDE
jgi:predicted DNA-binding protein